MYQQGPDNDCAAKAKERGQITFTLVEQDKSSPKIVALWIAENIETAPTEKLRHAFEFCIQARNCKDRKVAD